mgnify:CR=1 FL=1|tara:strand:- start:441 stop:665 length:225 start_codon:yes stop_codon:yes gene_type:complete
MFRTKEDLIDVYGWSVASRLLYIVELLEQGQTKDDIRELLVDHKPKPMMKPKSFEVLWNRYERISDKIEFVVGR